MLGRLTRRPHQPPPIKISDLTKKFANLPEKYYDAATRKVIWKTPRGIAYRPKEHDITKYYIGVHRPWSTEALQEESEVKHMPWVEPIRDWFIFKGDRVQVLVGKDAGKQGIVDTVIRERNWVIVTGLNAEIKPMTEDNGDVFMYEFIERPLLVPTQVSLVDPGDLMPTEVEWSWTEEGDKVRVSKRSGRIIPMSKRVEETYQYKNKLLYAETDKDTLAADMNTTFVPQLKTFEMEIAEEMGIEEDRIPKKTYWY